LLLGFKCFFLVVNKQRRLIVDVVVCIQCCHLWCSKEGEAGRFMENVARAELWEKVPNVRPSIPKKENLQHLSLEGRIILKYILREKY
jgi:hypothetical protein